MTGEHQRRPPKSAPPYPDLAGPNGQPSTAHGKAAEGKRILRPVATPWVTWEFSFEALKGRARDMRFQLAVEERVIAIERFGPTFALAATGTLLQGYGFQMRIKTASKMPINAVNPRAESEN